MAQYAVLICGSDSAHAPEATEEDFAVHTRHHDELVNSGVMVTAWALTPKDMATSVQEDLIEAAAAYRQALDLTTNEAERAFLAARLTASMA